jgi:hypothetical protein
VKADPLSEQVQIETCTCDVLPEHLKTENAVDDLVNELKAQLHQAEAPRWTRGLAGRRSQMAPLSAILHVTPSRLVGTSG